LETIAYFSNIRSHIQTELKSAKDSIFVAVAWFTDAKLLDILCQKATNGLDVQLIVMDDDITRNCSIDYNKLEVCGGKVFQINNEITGTLMHNKFCVIDKTNTITGSYNWSIKAQSNHENITITKDSECCG
jgi:phosphatidylserine/phosphatidylglycerophosphate/cardiolipin synthase-like enzyme